MWKHICPTGSQWEQMAPPTAPTVYSTRRKKYPDCINPISSQAAQEKPWGYPSEKQKAKLGVNRSHGVTQSGRRWVWAPKTAVTNHATVRINRWTAPNWLHNALLVPPPRKQLRRRKTKGGDASFTVKLLNLVGSLYLQSLNMLAKQIFPLSESNCTHYTTLSLELIFWQSNAHQ